MRQCQKTRPDPKAAAVLTIAGADPSGGAGIQRDIKTFRDFGLNGLSVITALTAQNQKRVKAVLPVSASFVIKQINCLLDEYSIGAVKLGMLARADIVNALTRFFKRARFKNIVLDPVLMSSSGYHLMDEGGVTCLKRLLLPLATIVTPNLNEAAVLAGMKKVSNPEDMKQAAIKIKRFGPLFVLVKGGHLKEPGGKGQGARGKKAVDILYDGKKFKTFASKMIDKEIHGTGCILSAAIASLLAKGMGVEDAVKRAKAYTTRIIISE